MYYYYYYHCNIISVLYGERSRQRNVASVNLIINSASRLLLRCAYQHLRGRILSPSFSRGSCYKSLVFFFFSLVLFLHAVSDRDICRNVVSFMFFIYGHQLTRLCPLFLILSNFFFCFLVVKLNLTTLSTFISRISFTAVVTCLIFYPELEIFVPAPFRFFSHALCS